MISPRARGKRKIQKCESTKYVSWAKHRFWFFLDGCLRSFTEGEVLCALACAFHGLSLSGEEMEVAGHHDAREKKPNPIHVERALGVRREARLAQAHVEFGCTLTRLSSSLQRTQDLSIAFRAEPRRTGWHQASPFHVAEVIRSSTFGGTSVPAFLHRRRCVDCLFCKFTDPSNSSVTGIGS